MRDYLRKENESLLGFYKRITDNRKEYDLDYSEWAKLILGEDKYSSDNARKAYYVVKPMLDSLDESNINNISDNEKIKEIEDKIHELEKIQLKVRTEKLELNKYKRIDARNEMLYDEFKMLKTQKFQTSSL